MGKTGEWGGYGGEDEDGNMNGDGNGGGNEMRTGRGWEMGWDVCGTGRK